MDFTKYRDFLAQTTPKYLQIQQAVDRAVRKAKRIRALLYPVYFLCLALALYSVYVSNFVEELPDPAKMLPYLKLFEGMEFPLVPGIFAFSAAVLLVVPLVVALVLKLVIVLPASREESIDYGEDPLENLKNLENRVEKCMNRESQASDPGGVMLILFLLNAVFTVVMVIHGVRQELWKGNIIVAVLSSLLAGGIVGVLALLATGLLSLPAMFAAGCSTGKRKQLQALAAQVEDMQKLAKQEKSQEEKRQAQERKRLQTEREEQQKARIRQIRIQAEELWQRGAYDDALELYRSVEKEDPQVQILMLCCLRRSSQTTLEDYRGIFRKLQKAMAEAPTEALKLMGRAEIDSMLQQLRTASEEDLEKAREYEEEFAYDKQLQILKKWADMGLPEGIGLYVSFHLTKTENAELYPELIERLEEALGLGFADHSVEKMCQNLVGSLAWEYGRVLLSKDKEKGEEYIRKAEKWGNADAHRYLHPPVVFAYVPQPYEAPKPTLRRTTYIHYVTGGPIDTDDKGNFFDENGNPVDPIYLD